MTSSKIGKKVCEILLIVGMCVATSPLLAQNAAATARLGGGSSFGHETFRIAIDRDQNAGTGCAGIDLILIVEVDSTLPTPMVVNIAYERCNGGGFEGPYTIDAGDWPVGLNNGVSTADVVEAYLPLGLLGETSGIKFTVEASSLAGGLDVAPNPPAQPYAFTFPAPIPALTQWGIFCLIALLLIAALILMRRRSMGKLGLVGLQGLSMFLLVAFTMMPFSPDGNVEDWNGLSPVGEDTMGDGGDDAVDLLAVFVANDEENLYLRFDVKDMENQPPNAVDDTAFTTEETPVTIDVLANDSDPDEGDTLTLESVSTPSFGTATITVDGRVLYTPELDAKGADNFTYTVADNFGATSTAQVDVTIGGVNDPPVAVDDAYTLDEGATLNQPAPGVLANDTDPDSGTVLTATVVDTPIHGTLSLASNGSFSYSHDGTNTTSDSFTYRASDGVLQSGLATVALTINPVNDPPTAVDDAFTVDEDSGLNFFDVLANDSSIEPSAVLTVSAVGVPSNGATVAVAAGGSGVNYTPAADFFGSETVTYTLSDGLGDTAQATITVTVNNVNDNPTASDDALAVDEDSSNNMLDVLANDSDLPDTGETLTITLVGATDNGGTVVINGGTMLDYSPAADFVGAETFTYTISDGNGGTATATVTVTVNNVNDPPVANDDTFNVDEDSADNNLDVLANDSILPDSGETLTISAVGATDNGGTVVINAGTSLTYTPAAGYVGPETFTYTIDDGNSGTDTAMVTVTVNNVNDPPTANDDAFAVAEDSSNTMFDVLANDSGLPDVGETLTISAVGATSNGGTVVISGGGTMLDYSPAANYFGSETFTYTIDDGNGGNDSATVTVTVNNVNDNPTASDDAMAVNEDSSNNMLDVLANDSDLPDTGETLTITLVGATSNGGTVVINGGTMLDYSPAADFVGAETFTYTISDGNGGTATATVTVTVNNVNDPPVANDDTFNVDEDSADNNLDVLANDSILPDSGETLTISAVGATNNGGTVVINAGTSLTYTPAAGYVGDETFTYTISDGNSGTDSASVTVTVNNVNDPPTANDDAFSVSEDSSNTMFDVLANDSGLPDVGETLTISAVGATSDGGTVVISGGGTMLDYSPAADFYGSETFTYTIDDGNGGNDSATVTVTVSNVNDNPTANNDAFSVNEDSSNNSLTVLSNDSSLPDPIETLTISAVGATSNGGTATISGGGTTIDYTPVGNFSGVETFTYTISDGNGGTDSATVTVTVDNVNDPPTANDDVFAASEGSTNNMYNPLANDSILPDVGETLTISAVGATSDGGTVMIAGGGTMLDYTPATDFFGSETFTYTISDGNGGSDSATVTVNVSNTDDPVTANPDSFATDEDTVLASSAARNVLDNDDAPDGGLSVIANDASSAQGAAVNVAGVGTFSYDPTVSSALQALDDGESIMDTFTYTAEDTDGDTDIGTVTITVDGANDAPVADDKMVTVGSGLGVVITLTGSDVDIENLSFAIGSGPANGTLTLLTQSPPTSATVLYTNDGGMATSDSFTYMANDGTVDSNTATVSITVSHNDAPVANDDGSLATPYKTNLNTAVDIDVAANDTDSDGTLDLNTVVVVTNPTRGTTTVLGGGIVRYTPNMGELGSDTFTYTIDDDFGDTSNEATVTVLINDLPVANDDSDSVNEDGSVNIDVLANDSDSDGTLQVDTVAVVSAPTKGIATANLDGTIDYAPNMGETGSDTFTYTVEDDCGATSNAATVTICINGLPMVADDSFNVYANVPVTIPVLNGVLSNDSDDSGCVAGAVMVTTTGSMSTTEMGTIDLAADGSFTYTPPAGKVQGDTDTFVYTASDGAGGTNTGTITFNFAKAVWFVDNTNVNPGDGTLAEPFQTLADAENASAENDCIFIYEGDTLSTNMDGGIILKNGQDLRGEGAGLDLDIDGLGTMITIVAPGNKARITNLAGDVITLADDNKVSHLILEPQASAAIYGEDSTPMKKRRYQRGARYDEDLVLDETAEGDLEGSESNQEVDEDETLVAEKAAGTTVITDIEVYPNDVSDGFEFNGQAGTLTLRNITIEGTGAAATGFGILFDSASSTLTLENINVSKVDAALLFYSDLTYTLTNCTISDNNSIAIESGFSSVDIHLVNTTITETAGAGAFNLSNIIDSGNSPGLTLDASSIVTVSNLAFGNTAINIDANGSAFMVTIDAALSIDASGGSDAIVLDSFTNLAQVDFNALTNIIGAGGRGLAILGSTGTFGFDDLRIDDADNTAFDVSNGGPTVNVTLNTTETPSGIDNTAGRSINIANMAGGAITFDGSGGDINDSGTGVLINGNNSAAAITFNNSVAVNTGTSTAASLTSNTGATISFLGGLDIDTTSGNGLAVSGGGTLAITGSANTINSTTGTAVSIANTTISASNINFESISVNGATNGIILSNTGILGRLILDGDGSTNGSAGTLQSTTGDALSLTNANADIAFLNITSPGDDGVAIAATSTTAQTVLLDSLNVTGATNFGFNITDTGSAGTLVIEVTNSAISSGNDALQASDSGAGGRVELDLTGNSFVSTTGQLIDVNGSGLNTITVTGFGSNTFTANGTDGGVSFDRVTFDADTGTGGIQAVSAGAASFGQGTPAGQRLQGDGLELINPTGRLDFTTLSVFNNIGTGIEVNTKGAGTTFTLTSTGGTVNTLTGPALFLDPLAASLTFGTVTSNGSGTTGVTVDSVSASSGNALTITTLDVDNTTAEGVFIQNSTGAVVISGGDISTTAGTAFRVGVNATNDSGSSGNISYGGTINNAAGSAVQVYDRTGGTVTFSGAIVDSGATNAGIQIEDNDSGNPTIQFTSTVDLTGTSGAGLTVNDNTSATISFADLDIDNSAGNTTGITASANGTTNGLMTTTGNINAGNGRAIDIDNTRLGMTLFSVRSVGGTVPGIDLNTTTGGLTVTGNGATAGPGVLDDNNGSGGSCSNKTGDVDGVLLSSATNVSLNYMTISGNSRNGVSATSVNGFVLTRCNLTDNADQAAPNEAALLFANLSGTSLVGANPTRIANCLIKDSFENNMEIQNSSGLLTNLVIDDCSFENDGGSTLAANHLNFLGVGTATMTLDVNRCNFTGSLTPGMLTATAVFGDAAATATVNVNVQDSLFVDNNNAVNLSTSAGGNMTFDITDNGTTLVPINCVSTCLSFVGNSTATGTISGIFDGNVIGNPLVALSGSSAGRGIQADMDGAGSLDVTITNNLVRETQFNGIRSWAQDVVGGAITATITNNSLTNIPSNGIYLRSRDTVQSHCVAISGNTFTNVTSAHIRLSEDTEAMTLQRGAANLADPVATVLTTNNPGATTQVTGTPTVINNGACP